MNLQGKKVTLHDMSLRDGMHPQRHQLTPAQMVEVATELDAAGVPLIEVTHGDGLGGASVNYGFPAASDEEYLRAVVPKMSFAKISALLIPGIGTVDHLRMARDCGVETIRVATHCTEADVSEQHINLGANMEMDTVGFLRVTGRAATRGTGSWQLRYAYQFEKDGIRVIRLATDRPILFVEALRAANSPCRTCRARRRVSSRCARRNAGRLRLEASSGGS